MAMKFVLNDNLDFVWCLSELRGLFGFSASALMELTALRVGDVWNVEKWKVWRVS